jgi:uncharacterized protein DUF2247
MNSLERLASIGIPVTWGTILVGFEGGAFLARSLTGSEVQAFAEERASTMTTVDPPLLDLLSANPYDDDDIASALRALSELDSEGLDREQRKWRLLLVADFLRGLPDDPVDALTGITELWSSLGYPGDSPHIVQGRGNSIDPRDYYTASTRDSIVDRHVTWLSREQAELASPEA